MFGIDQWGGVKKEKIDLVEKEINMAAHYALCNKFHNKSNRQRLNELGWLPLQKEIQFATMKATHKIINVQIPVRLASMMPINTNHLRIQDQKKLAAKPHNLDKNKTTRALFRNRAYLYNTLPGAITKIESRKKFNEQLKSYMMRN